MGIVKETNPTCLHLPCALLLELPQPYIEILILLFQEFCLDLNHPNGLGRRRRSSGFGEASPEPEKLKRRRNFFPVDNSGNDNIPDRNGTTSDDNKSAKIDENVALTVVIPGGECCWL